MFVSRPLSSLRRSLFTWRRTSPALNSSAFTLRSIPRPTPSTAPTSVFNRLNPSIRFQLSRPHDIRSVHSLSPPTLRPLLNRPPSQWPPPLRPHPPSPYRVTSDGYTHFSRQANNSPRNPLTRYLLGFSAAGILTYIYVNTDYAPFTGRRRIMGVSRQYELELGRHTYNDLLQSFQGRLLSPHHPVSIRVRRIVSKLAATARSLNPNLCHDFEWAIVVADVEEPNAMCVPGGRILITTGLLNILRSDDDVAVVLAHEIAHALNRHGAETMHLHRLMMPVILITNHLFDSRVIPSILASLLLSLPYSRSLEYEADKVGLMLSTEACYDPKVAPEVFQILANAQNEKSGSFVSDKMAPLLSTHPQSRERAKRLHNELKEKSSRFKDKCIHGSFPQFVRDWGEVR